MAYTEFSELVGEITPEQRSEIEALKDEAWTEIVAHNLSELRRHRSLTQAELARRLGRAQSSISAMEAAPDHLLSTLRAAVEGMGGTLELTAAFEDESVPLSSSPSLPSVVSDHERATVVVRARIPSDQAEFVASIAQELDIPASTLLADIITEGCERFRKAVESLPAPTPDISAYLLAPRLLERIEDPDREIEPLLLCLLALRQGEDLGSGIESLACSR